MRTIRLRRGVCFFIATWLSTTAFSCQWGGTPAPGYHSIPLPFYYQTDYYRYCVPASIQMWWAYLYGAAGVPSQDDIYDWVALSYPNDVYSGGMTLNGAAAAAIQFLYQTFIPQVYSGVAGRRQAAADQQQALDAPLYSHTMVSISNNTHVVMVRGASW